ncbi:MAG: hypothetical protein H8D34_17530, partial [Chloroflexi bacterium]|nr:hypothetical protein [Chloroflexota bacterium]
MKSTFSVALKITTIAIAFSFALANFSFVYADDGENPHPPSTEMQTNKSKETLDVGENLDIDSADDIYQTDQSDQLGEENNQSLIRETIIDEGSDELGSDAIPGNESFYSEGQVDTSNEEHVTEVNSDPLVGSALEGIQTDSEESQPRDGDNLSVEVAESQQEIICDEPINVENDESEDGNNESCMAPEEPEIPEQTEVKVIEEPSPEEKSDVEDEEPTQLEKDSSNKDQEFIIPDPYFFVDNVKHSYLPAGGDCNGALKCAVSSTPIQDAIDAVTGGLTPDDGTIYMEGGIYEENVSIINLDLDLTLQGGIDGNETSLNGSFFIGNSLKRIVVRQLEFNAGFSVVGSVDVTAQENIFNSGVAVIDSNIDVDDSSLNAGMAVVNSSAKLVNCEVNAGIAEINSNVDIIDADQDGIADISAESSAVSVENTTFSDGSSVMVENSTLDISGTSGDDVIEVNLTGNLESSVVIDGGEGSDRLTFNLDGTSDNVDVTDSGTSGDDSLVLNLRGESDTQVGDKQVRAGDEIVRFEKIEELGLNAESNIDLSGTIVIDEQLTIVSEQGSILQPDGKLVTERLVLQAAGGVGSIEKPINTKATKLAAQAVDTGGVYIENEGGLIIAKIDDVVGVSASGGGIGISSSGPITICNCVKESGSGDILITANDDRREGSSININAEILASGGNGNVTINAADDIIQASGSTVSTTGVGKITIEAGQRSHSAAISISGTVGSENGAINLIATNGIVLAENASISTAGELYINADSDGDGIGSFVLFETAEINVQDNNFEMIAADIDLDGQINIGSGDVSFEPSQEDAERFIGIEGVGFSLSSAELMRVLSIGTLSIGAETNYGVVRVDELELSTASYDLSIYGGEFDLGKISLALGMVLQLAAIGGIFDRNGNGRNITIPGGSLLIRAANFGTQADVIETAVDMLSAQINLVGGAFVSDLNHHDPPQADYTLNAGLYIINDGNLTIGNHGLTVDGEVSISVIGRLDIVAPVDGSSAVRLTAYELDVQSTIEGDPVSLREVPDPHLTSSSTLYNYLTIQEAINAVAGGLIPDDNTIYVESGTYTENLTLTNLSDLIILVESSGEATIAGTISITNGANIQFEGFSITNTITLTDSSNIYFVGTSGADSFDFSLDGTGDVSVDSAAGTDTVSLDGTLEIEITSAADYDQFTVTNTETLNLSGTLEVTLVGGYTPSVGNNFEFMTFGSVSNDFTSFSGLWIGSGQYFKPVMSGSNYVLQVTKVPGSFENVTLDTQTMLDDLMEVVANKASGPVTVSGSLEFSDFVTASGSIGFERVGTQIKVAANNVSSQLVAGSFQAGISNGSLAMILHDSGERIVYASGTFNLSGGDFANASGTITVKENNTGSNFSAQDVTVDAVTVSVAAIDDGVQSLSGTNLNVDVSGFISLTSGSMGFKKVGSEIVAAGNGIT